MCGFRCSIPVIEDRPPPPPPPNGAVPPTLTPQVLMLRSAYEERLSRQREYLRAHWASPRARGPLVGGPSVGPQYMVWFHWFMVWSVWSVWSAVLPPLRVSWVECNDPSPNRIGDAICSSFLWSIDVGSSLECGIFDGGFLSVAVGHLLFPKQCRSRPFNW